MKDKILICERNRDGARIWLERVGETNDYTVHTDKPFVLNYARIIYQDVPDDALIYDFNWNGKKAICSAYDPSGGPYISVGASINEQYKIGRIFNDTELKFSILKNENI